MVCIDAENTQLQPLRRPPKTAYCVRCATNKGREHFSASQLAASARIRRCKSCIEADRGARKVLDSLQTGCNPDRYLEPPRKKTKTGGKDGAQGAEHTTVTDLAMSMHQTKDLYLDMPGGGIPIHMPSGNGPIDVPDGGGGQHHGHEAEPPEVREHRYPNFVGPRGSHSRRCGGVCA